MKKVEIAHHVVRFNGDRQVQKIAGTTVWFTDGSWCDVATGHVELHGVGVISWSSSWLRRYLRWCLPKWIAPLASSGWLFCGQDGLIVSNFDDGLKWRRQTFARRDQ